MEVTQIKIIQDQNDIANFELHKPILVTLYLSDEGKTQLESLQKRLNLSYDEIVDDAIYEYLFLNDHQNI